MSSGLSLQRLDVRVGGAVVVSDLTLEVPPGTSLAITGPAATGKSTVLATLAGQRPPAAGTVLLDGGPVTVDRVGVVDQQHSLLGGLTAAENVAVRALSAGGLGERGWTTIEQLLQDLGLPASAWHNLVEQLSGGQQQRVAVARALVDRPRLLCLDDPVSELDAASAETVLAALDAACATGTLLVLGTSNPDLTRRCHQVLRLSRS